MRLQKFKKPYDPYDFTIMLETIGYGRPRFRTANLNGIVESVFEGFVNIYDHGHISFGVWFSLVPHAHKKKIEDLVATVVKVFEEREPTNELLYSIIRNIHTQIILMLRNDELIPISLALEVSNNITSSLEEKVMDLERRVMLLESAIPFNPLQKY